MVIPLWSLSGLATTCFTKESPIPVCIESSVASPDAHFLQRLEVPLGPLRIREDIRHLASRCLPPARPIRSLALHLAQLLSLDNILNLYSRAGLRQTQSNPHSALQPSESERVAPASPMGAVPQPLLACDWS